MSSGGRRLTRGDLAEGCEDLPGQVAFETADDLPFGVALLDTPGHVVTGGGVVAPAHHHDPARRWLGLTATARWSSTTPITHLPTVTS